MTKQLRIVHDTDTQSPRESCDNLGTMVCWHRRYILGDERPTCTGPEWLAEVTEYSVILPLFLYDHSGLALSTGDFGDRWDSGQVGWIYVTPAEMRKEYSVKVVTDEIRARAEAALRVEVKVYSDYLAGNCWGYEISELCGECDHEKEVTDSCYGFIGESLEDTALPDYLKGEGFSDNAIQEAWEGRGP